MPGLSQLKSKTDFRCTTCNHEFTMRGCARIIETAGGPRIYMYSSRVICNPCFKAGRERTNVEIKAIHRSKRAGRRSLGEPTPEGPAQPHQGPALPEVDEQLPEPPVLYPILMRGK